jgi:hypothetical protein
MSFYHEMRTDSVRVGRDDTAMNPMISEALMRERRRQVEQAASRYWQFQERRPRPRRRAQLRTGAGWMLVRVGARLADVEVSAPPELHPVAT